MAESQSHLPVSDEEIVDTLHRILNASGKYQAASLLRRCNAHFVEGNYDNWNGGTYSIVLYIQVAPETFALLEERKETLQTELTSTLQGAVSGLSTDWYSVQIVPMIVGMKGRPDLQGGPLSKRTKRAIIAKFKSDRVVWYGSLTPPEFLKELYDLNTLPSTDHRFQNASEDIWQHTVRNDDWPLDWLYTDDRFSLLSGADANFLGFLERCLDPSVRSVEDARVLASMMNAELQRDGWQLEAMQILGDEAKFRAAPWNPAYARAADSLQRSALVLSSTWMFQEIQRIEASINNDPALAIGTAKDLIDTCCKHILDARGIVLNGKPDTPDLVKAVLEDLKLVPAGISDQAKGAETIKKTLRTLTTLTQGLAEIRNLYGTGHGKNTNHRGLQPRHARLAVASAAAFIEFIVGTHKERKKVAEG
jgi:hypothetical protein